jgi:tetratricopeptide (TPR) repeat protein
VKKFRLNSLILRGLAGVMVVGAVILPAPPLQAAILDDFPEVMTEELLGGDELTQRVQKHLRSMGLYQGLADGKMSRDLGEAIKKYQQMLGHKVDGAVTDKLLEHLDTQSKVGAMLNRLDSVRETNIESARAALLKNEETRTLLEQNRNQEIADPTRDSTPCFRKPEEKRLLEEAIESAKAIHRPELRDWAFGEILVAQTKAGLTDDAIGTVRRIGDARLIIVALRDIARAHAQAGRIEQALEAVQIIPDRFKQMEALAAIADIQLKRDDGDGAHETAAQAVAFATTLRNPLHQVSVLAQMGVILNKVGDPESAQAALYEAQGLIRSSEVQDQLNKLEKGAALRHIAAAFSEIGQPTRALKLFEEVSGQFDRTAVLMSAATSLANAGDTESAMETARKIDSGRYRSVVLGRIAIAYARQKKLDEAMDIIDEAMDTTNDIELPYARSYAISQLTHALIEIGTTIDKSLLPMAVVTAQEIENDRLRAFMLWSVSGVLSDKGLKEARDKAEKLARDATDAIGSSLSQVWMLSDLASEDLRRGRKDRAANTFNQGIAIAETIHNAWGRARALAKMASTLSDFSN